MLLRPGGSSMVAQFADRSSELACVGHGKGHGRGVRTYVRALGIGA